MLIVTIAPIVICLTMKKMRTVTGVADIEKTKRGLRCCKNSYPKDCKHCPYEKDCTHHETCDILIRNALSVIEQMEKETENLKEQLTEALAVRGW